MRIWSLGSGSKGNAMLVECGDTRVVVDAGFPRRTLARRLGAIGVAPGSISACLITHEHTDHTRGAALAAAKWGWSLHATVGTIANSPELADASVQRLSPGETIAIGRADVTAVRVSHDATEPVGFVITDRESGARAAIVYDLGTATESLRRAMRDVDVLVLEANHCETMLRDGPYPLFLQKRIGCHTGHLSNRAAAELCAESAHANLGCLVLAHLSEQNNDHGVAMTTVSRAMARTRFRGTISTALQHGVAGPFTPRSGRRAAATQLALW
jgi:phosphoribosyl 1,2-cyclic phosphodiesterase